MDEIIKTEELNEQVNPVEEVATTEQESSQDPLREAVEAQMKKIQHQSMLLGAQTFCHIVLQKIAVTESKPGKTTMADYRRLIKDIRQFCETGISRKVNADGETEPIEEESTTEETVQN